MPRNFKEIHCSKTFEEEIIDPENEPAITETVRPEIKIIFFSGNGSEEKNLHPGGHKFIFFKQLNFLNKVYT